MITDHHFYCRDDNNKISISKGISGRYLSHMIICHRKVSIYSISFWICRYHFCIRAGWLRAVTEWEGEVLEIARISRLDMSAYLCIASNGVPPSVSKRIKVSVDCEYACMMMTCLAPFQMKTQHFLHFWFNKIFVSFFFLHTIILYCVHSPANGLDSTAASRYTRWL